MKDCFSPAWMRENVLPAPVIKHDSWASHLGLGACLIHQVKGGADHLDLIDAEVAESFVVPFWRPSPVRQ